MAFRFVHAADVHLNSPLRSLALRNAELAELIGDASRQVLMNIVDLCLNEKVDALLLAGDLYDGDQTSMKTARFLAAQVRRLDEAGIRVFIIRGNHDAISRITRELTLPESVTIFGGRADAVSLERERGALPVVVHGLSFSQPHAPESLLPKYRAPVSDAVNIGLMHTSLEGAVGHDPYAPCGLADLAASGFDYWALGHIHKRAEHQGKPGSIACVVMAGIPQGRDINEGGTKSVTLVTVNDDRSITLEECSVSIAEFVRVPVDMQDVVDWREAVLRMESALGEARRQAGSDHLVSRLALTGATPLSWRLRRDADMLRAEAEDRAAGIGRTWIDRIEIDCRPPVAAGSSSTAERSDSDSGYPLGELESLMRETVSSDPSFRQGIEDMAQELRAHLPPECRAALGDDEVTAGSVLDALAQEGMQEVLARLQGRAAEAAQEDA